MSQATWRGPVLERQGPTTGFRATRGKRRPPAGFDHPARVNAETARSQTPSAHLTSAVNFLNLTPVGEGTTLP